MKLFQNKTAPPSFSRTRGRNRELIRLMTAAVINPGFCQLLLTNPGQALVTGYNGLPFRLASEEQNLVLSIHATSLSDFATQLTGQAGQPIAPQLAAGD